MSEYLNNAKDTIKNNIPDTAAISSGISGVADGIRSATKSATDSFSSKDTVAAGSEFLASNGMIAKFVFVILILIAFMFFLNLGVSLVTYLTTPSKSPYIIHGMLPGNATTIYAQNPGNGNPVVYRSNNQDSGVEFTWSMWLNIMNVPSGATVKPIFVKGTDVYDSTGGDPTVTVNGKTYTGIANVNNGPGAYLIPYTDPSGVDGSGQQVGLLYVMDVVSPVDGANQKAPFAAVIPNLPIKKWVHVAIRLQNKVLDCYVNGVITQRVSFGDHVPKQNYDSIIYAGNDGFNGSTSNLRYYDHALSVFEINSIVYYGPNLKSAAGKSSSFFDYLGQPWYNYGTNDKLATK
jgi:hypothetical protein